MNWMKKNARVSGKLVSPGLPGLQVATRLTVDYGVPAFYNALPQYLKNPLKNELVHIEKRALSIILLSMSYNKACEVVRITQITEHHSQLCSKLFDAIVTDPNHKLHGLLP